MMPKALLRLFSAPVAMDLGTATSLLYTEKDGIVVREPSLVAYDKSKKTVVAVGTSARAYAALPHDHIELIRPLHDGGIADLAMAGHMIAAFVRKVLAGRFTRPAFVIAVPGRISQMEKRAVVDAALFAGASAVSLIPESMAACIGAGLPVNDPEGHMVLVIGGGTSEIAVVSLGGLVRSRSIRTAGCAMTDALVRYLHDTFRLLVSHEAAEEAKLAIASLVAPDTPSFHTIAGKDAVNGSLRSVQLTDAHVREAIAEPVRVIGESVLETLEETPPELACDLAKNGLLLAGGGALLQGLDDYLASTTSLPVVRDTDPLTTVLRGTALVMTQLEHYRHLILS